MPDETEPPYVSLKRQRTAYLGEVQDIQKQADEFNPANESIRLIKSARDALVTLNKDYNKVYNKLLLHDDAIEVEITNHNRTFKRAQATAIAKVEEILEAHEKLESRKVTQEKRNELEAIKIQLDEFEAFIDEETEDGNPITEDEVQARMPDLQSLSEKYLSTWNKIYPHENAEAKKEMEEKRKEFLKSFYNTVAFFKSKMSPPPPPQPQTPRASTSEASIKLPRLDLPKFDGDVKMWVNFRDTYKSLVHNVNTLSGLVKFRYLKTSITDPNSPIAHLLETENGYKDAWDAVVDRYEDPRGILRCHFNEILGVEKMKSESADELLRVLNAYTLNVSALERMHKKEELYDAIIAHLVLQRLDPRTLDLWETKKHGKTPYWSELEDFLKCRRKTLSAMEIPAARSSKPATKPSGKPTTVLTSTQGTDSSEKKGRKEGKRETKRKCHMCGNEHMLFKCPQFANLPVRSRASKVAEWKVCTGCFGPHKISDCASKYRCKTCKQHHHTLLHPEQPDSSQRTVAHSETSTLQPTAPPFTMTTPSCYASSSNRNNFTLLQTAIVSVEDANGEWQNLRAFFDSGSDSNFITMSAANALRIPLIRTHIEANGLGGNKAAVIKNKMTANVGKANETLKMEFLVTPKLTNLSPAMTVAKNQIKIPPNLPLADPTFDVPGKIDMLIGNEFYGEIMRDGRIKLDSGPVMLNTLFGWIFTGNVPHGNDQNQRKNPRTTNFITTECHHSTLTDIKNSMEKFYVIEDYRNKKRFLTPDEVNSQTHFEQTHRRLKSGRLMVEILYNKKLAKVKNNYKNALCQFLSNERRWQKNESIGTRVHAFMKEYEKLEHMRKIDISMETLDDPAFYLPYHAVENPDSTTTKLRIVFNGSSPSPSGVSINDAQCVGPQVQSDIFTLSLRFRTHQIVIKADIEKMYRQIEIAPHQRRFQRIIYRENPSEKLQAYELNTVTYGTAAASYLATRCIQELGIVNQNSFPEAAEAIIDDVYVDDVITGAPTVEKAGKLANDIINILAGAGMKLRKFTSNSSDFLRLIPTELHDSPSPNSAVKTLGRLWFLNDDTMGFEDRSVRFENVTRRIILSEIASNYDPDGVLGPVTFNFKKFIKVVFNLQLPWDAKLPEKEASEWKQIASTMPEIAKIRIPRLVLIENHVDIQLHGFCDASELGYGACVYVRSANPRGISTSRLICSKSRIAPKEYRSIARLELCGAVILANLIQQVDESLKLPISRKICWSDSAIALQWLKRCPSTLHIFVANRVSEIREIAPDVTWRHIRGDLNPADLLSRGLTPKEISTSSSWWFGPNFLAAPETTWPESIVQIEPDELTYTQELKREVNTMSTVHNELIKIVEDSSRLFEAKWKIAKFLRCVHKMRMNPRIGPIQVDDLLDAEYAIARMCQLESFPVEYQKCSDGLHISKRSKLKNLDPIWDPVLKLMRVGGRLNRARHCDERQRNPIILPNCHFTRLIIRETHEKNLHAGQNATHSFVRLRYWPLRCKHIVKQEVHKCVKCFRARPKLIEQMMGQLPPERVTPSSIFHHSGVDYCGPFEIKVSKLRSARTMKSYVAIFVCLSTKAVHLEVVTDLNTAAFFSAFDKFVSRRGLPATMSSDHGLNFVGAANELQKLHDFLAKSTTQAEILAYLAEQEIKWKFIPPRAPTHGGLWEAAVKSMKHHLIRVASTALLTFEEFERLTAKIEAIMNSRPLTAMSEDPSDLSALTAGHFLIGRPLIAKAEKNVTEQPITRLQRWDRVMQMQQQFWKRWSTEYLHLLQVRTKNFDKIIPVKIGHMVLVHVDNCPSMKWPLGRITDIFPGSDGITRIAKVRTATSTYERPVDKLALLPIEDNE